jgi:hypothetical protein
MSQPNQYPPLPFATTASAFAISALQVAESP